MPDENKFKVLYDAAYTVRPCCGLCEHGEFPMNPGTYWGTCKVNRYDHLKHSGGDRGVSIHKFGSCPKFVENKRKSSHLQSFLPFFKEHV